MVNVSYIIGAGIFVGPALTLQLVGSGGMNLIIWFIGALVAFSGTFVFMELGTMVIKAALIQINASTNWFLYLSCPEGNKACLIHEYSVVLT